MFDEVDTSKELSARLRQDMNPDSQGTISEPPQPTPVKPASPLAPMAPPPPLVPVQATSEDVIEPVVETSPFIREDSAGGKGWLAWASLILILPSVFFWFCSLLYIAGSKTILVKIVSAVSFIFIVSANTALPILTLVLSFIILRRTEAGESGRGLAKLAMVLAGLALLALIVWLLAEVF